MTVRSAPPAPPLSTLIRSATRAAHQEAERAPFLRDLLEGRLGRGAFAEYTAQLWFVYRALEEGARRLAGDQVAGPFVRPELDRLPSLERDLDHLYGGTDWRAECTPLPATAAYAARIAETSRRWPGGYVAHHYTRYLGDLSGGQVIRGAAERRFGLARKGDGVRFYVFEDVPNPAAFKRDYRALLDAMEAGTLEKRRIAEECGRAFGLNTALFAELASLRPGGR